MTVEFSSQILLFIFFSLILIDLVFFQSIGTKTGVRGLKEDEVFFLCATSFYSGGPTLPWTRVSQQQVEIVYGQKPDFSLNIKRE